jgi:hypothetical protein
MAARQFTAGVCERSLRLWRRYYLEKPYGKPDGACSAGAVIDQFKRGRERSSRCWVLSERGRVGCRGLQAHQHLQPAADWLAWRRERHAVEIKGVGRVNIESERIGETAVSPVLIVLGCAAES